MENKVTNINRQEELVGVGVGFERIRRITGYLVGTLDRFNNAKRAEEHDRVKHTAGSRALDDRTQANEQKESRTA